METATKRYTVRTLRGAYNSTAVQIKNTVSPFLSFLRF